MHAGMGHHQATADRGMTFPVFRAEKQAAVRRPGE